MQNVVIGDYIKIIKMEGEPKYTGKEGNVLYIDDMGQIHGTWGGIAVDVKRDIIKIKKKH